MYNKIIKTDCGGCMNFGEYLEELIRKRDLSINALSNECKINRGGLYSVFKNQRKLKSDQLFNLISKLALTKTEEKKLKELYFKELYGQETFERINFLLSLIKNCDLHIDTENFISALDNDAIKKIQCFLNQNNVVITNFPFDFLEVDALFFNAVKSGKITEFTHIILFDDGGGYKSNYNSIFKSLKYMCLHQFPYYFYTSIKSINENTIMPYFAIGNRTALLFTKDQGIEIACPHSVKILKQKAESLLAKCKTFGMKIENVIQVKNFYQKGISNGSTAVTLSSYPCLSLFLDKETMISTIKPELPNKEALVNIAYSHYSNLPKHIQSIDIVPESGIKKFAKTGNLCEFSEELVNFVDVEHRIRILEKIVAAIESNKFFLLDKNKISIQPGIMIEKYVNKVIFFRFNEEKNNFSTYDSFYADLEDFSLVNDFNLMYEYIIKSRLVCSTDYSVQFINNIIEELKTI